MPYQLPGLQVLGPPHTVAFRSICDNYAEFKEKARVVEGCPAPARRSSNLLQQTEARFTLLASTNLHLESLIMSEYGILQ